METEKKNSGILIGMLIGIIVTLFVVGGLFATGFIQFRTSTTTNNEQTNENNQSTTNDDNNGQSDYSNQYITTTNDKVRMNLTQDYYEYAEISIEQGNLVVQTSKYKRGAIVNNIETTTKDDSYVGVTKTFSINNEKAKYIMSMYYQPGGNTFVLVLTENGNLYINEMFAIDKTTIDSVNNFKKTNYSNIEGIIKLKEDNSGSEGGDGMPYYYAAIINDEPIRIDYSNIQ